MNNTIDQKVEFATLVRAEPERVYDALTTAEGLDGWFTKGSSVDARPWRQNQISLGQLGYQHYSGEDGGPVLAQSGLSVLLFNGRSIRIRTTPS